MSKDKGKKVNRNNQFKAELLAKSLEVGHAENTKYTNVSEDFQAGLVLNTERTAYVEGFARATKLDEATVRLCHEAGVKAVEKQREKLARDAANKRAKKAAEIAARKDEFLNTVVPRTEFVQSPNPDTTDDEGAPLADETVELLQAQA